MNRSTFPILIVSALFIAGCSEGVSDEEGARLAYLGADGSVALGLDLGFAGFNAAQSANIPEQQGLGRRSGRLIVNGQVNQGTSDNKGMRLLPVYDDYSDELIEDLDIVYDSSAPLALDLSMKGLPNAELTGTLVGQVELSGDLEGAVAFNLVFTGFTEEDPNTGGYVSRVPGTTHVTGFAESEYGRFAVDLVR